MMNMKKMLALLLAVVMVVGMMPMGVLAEETDPSVPETTTAAQETTVPETTAAANTEEEDNKGGLLDKIVEGAKNILIGGDSGDTTTPTGNTNPTGNTEPAGNTNPTETTGTATEPTTAPTTAPTEGKTVCGNCGGEHKTEDCKACVFCKNETCTCVTCDECGVKNDHTSTCSKNACADCGKNPCECKADETTAPTETTSPTEETTVPTTEGVEVCEHCGVELVEGAEHKEDCLSLCTCDPKPEEGEAHGEECPLYEEIEEEPVETVTYSGVTASGIGVSVLASENAFPEGTTLSVSDTVVQSAKKRFATFSRTFSQSTDLGTVAVDIDFGGTQPSESVVLTLRIPDSEVPEGANQVSIVHYGENGPETVSTQILRTDVSVHAISVAVDGFSTYAAVFQQGKYSSQLMSSLLSGNSRYSISNFKIDLFDYDPVPFNASLNAATSDGNGFHLTGYGVAGCSSNSGINNSEATIAKQGILSNTLVDGLPVINYLNGTNAGVETGKILFSDTTSANGKTIYKDIPFEFIFDSETGYYEYKSSANHAQFQNNKIVLYADTLSTQNNYIATVDLSTGTGASDFKDDIKMSANSFIATASDTAANSRIDPYVVFTVNDVEASSVGQIYVKAKIPASVGANGFQIFFTTDKSTGVTEDKSFGNPSYSKAIPYTANGDWIEFLIDTSENANWKDKITGVRVDLFDSNKGSDIDVTGSYPIEIAQISFIRKNYDEYATRGGFYPFSEIAESFPGNNTKFSYSRWQELMVSNTLVTDRASRSIFNPSPSPATDLYAELAYGLVMEFDFYLPVDQDPAKPLTYYFNGDDDLWVFVDNQIVLDIGGGHGAITGSVNFTTGETSVDNAVTVTGYNSGATATASKKTALLNSSLYSPGKHTMKVFYLERGGSVSNCFMKFNLPQTPQGSVRIKKDVAETDSHNLSVLSKEKFEFEIQAKNHGAGDNQEWAPLANQVFYIQNSDGSTEDAKTDANGKFKLSHLQEAYFDIDENYEVKLTEAPHDIDGYVLDRVTVNGENGTTTTQITVKNEQKDYNFINYYNENEVVLTYIPVNPSNCPEDGKGTVELTGIENSATSAATGVNEEIGARVGIPVGSTAEETSTVKFVGWYSNPECTEFISSDPEFMPVKPMGSDLWVEATYYAKFEYKYGNLKIEKTGIQSSDHDAESPVEELQSTIYMISGTSANGTEINMEVVIVGNSFVMIKDLPVGNYTVKEKDTWSWRYDPESNERTVEVVGNQTTTTEFNNVRNKPLWLSGDCYCENNWGTTTGLKSN